MRIAKRGIGLCLLIAAGVLLPVAALGQNSDTKGLQGSLEKVGAEYAKDYMSPMTQTFGVNQNSGLYTTAAIPKSKLTFSLGIKVMDTRIATEDQFFHRVLDNVILNESWGVQPGNAFYGQQGTVEMGGPTVFGPKDSNDDGYVRAYHDGVLVGEGRTIAGVIKTRDVPLALPEVSVGGLYGARLTVRWLPTVKGPEEVGDIKLFGWGLQGNINQFLPMLPVDAMIGFFHQKLTVGDVIEARATSVFLAASKSYGILTGYAGLSRESSNFKVHYTYNPDPVTGLSPAPISFDEDGRQRGRFTLGACVNLGVKLNADVNFGGNLTTFSGGLMFGI